MKSSHLPRLRIAFRCIGSFYFQRLCFRTPSLAFGLLPEPFLGRVGAPIVLLNLNPGFHKQDHLFHSSETGNALIRSNLNHLPMNYPFYLLNPQTESATGSHWWRQRLRPLIEAAGRIGIANCVLCIEYFPYHSTKYGGRLDRITIPSQEYTLDLVRQAMERDAFIVHMRSRNSRWFQRILQLEHYPRSAVVKNHQKPFISRGNLPDDFDTLVKIAVDHSERDTDE